MGSGNPTSGHTNHNLTVNSSTTNVDGLADGDHILSPTLTNMVEGIHGNGIMMYQDTALDASERNQPHNLPGAVDYVNDTTFKVKGGHVVLDGVMYEFAGGVGVTTNYTLTSGSASNSHTSGPAAVGSGKERLVVVYACADDEADVKHIFWETGSDSPIETNSYPSCPSAFLSAPQRDSAGLANTQTVVLAVLRVIYAAGSGDLTLKITEVNDKRIFIRPTPLFFSPVTTGDLDETEAIDIHTGLDTFHTNEVGDFSGSRFGGMWQSYGTQLGSTTAPDVNKDVLYYSGTHAARFTRSVFDRVLTSTATSITLKSTDANILLLTPSGNATVTTSGSFPAGYIIEIRNLHASRTVAFARASSYSIAGGTLTRFVCTTSHATTPVFSVLSDDSIETVQLANDSVTTAKIVDDAITSAKIADGAVIAAAIGADAVTAAKIGDDVINSEHIAAGAVDLAHMSVNSIDSDQYVNASIDTAHIGDNQITNALMADNAIDTAELAASAVETAKINNAAVTADKLASNAVTTVKINADAVTSAKIADDAVDTEHIADDAIEEEHIGAGEVKTAAIGDEQVTLAKLAHAAANTVLVRDANSAGDPSFKAVTNTQILIGDGTGFTAAALSGDATMTNAGVVAIGNDKITANMIGDNVLNSEHYAAGSIDNEHLADDAVDSDELAAGAVDDAHLSDGVATGLAGAGTTATSGVINVIGGNGITANANDVAITAAQTTITSVTNAGLTVGRDTHNLIDFGTDNQIKFKTNNETPVIIMKASGEIEATKFDGALEGNADTATLADEATILATARAINGVDFDGSAAITVTAAGSTLSDTVTVAKGGTGATSLTDGGVLLGSGTGAVTAMGVLGNSEMIVGDGTTDPVAESGATLRTSIGVGTGDTVQLTGINLGHATDTTIARASAGDVNIEGNIIYRAGGTDVASGDIADNAITLAKMAGIARGKIIVGDASGDPSVLAAGANGKLLVADANGDPSWTTVSGDVTTSAGAVTIAADAVTTAKILNANVTTAKIADDAVTADKLAANAVVNASVAAGAAIAFTKLENLDSTKMLVGNGSNKATEVAISGDITMANTGAVTIGATKITNGMLADNAVDTEEINADAVTSAKIADDAVDTEHIADDAIEEEHIGAGEVKTAAIANSNVTLAKIANIADDTVLGNIAGSAAAPAALTAAQLRTLLNIPVVEIMKYVKTGTTATVATNLTYDNNSGAQFLVDIGSSQWDEDTTGTSHPSMEITSDYGIKFLQTGIYQITSSFNFHSTSSFTGAVTCIATLSTTQPNQSNAGWKPSSVATDMGFNRFDVTLSSQNLSIDPDFTHVFNITSADTTVWFYALMTKSGINDFHIRGHGSARVTDVAVTRLGNVQT